MKNIIVPTDFSTKSFNALFTAKKIARKAKNTVIHLLHVVESPHNHYSVFGESIKDGEEDLYTLLLVKKLKVELETLKKAHEEDSFDIQIDLNIGDPFQEISNLVSKLDADLVIMGASGMSDAEEFFIGSLTDKVVRSMSCPVMAVKSTIDEESFDNIVYATDLQEDHKALMNLLVRFQDLFGSTVHIVKINTTKDFKNEIDAKVALRKLADRYGLKNYTMSTYSHEDEEYGIIYFADERGADLIVMGTHEKSGFRRLISGGSIAEEVTDHTFRPVLTYRFQEEA